MSETISRKILAQPDAPSAVLSGGLCVVLAEPTVQVQWPLGQ